MKFFTTIFSICFLAISLNAQTYCLQLEEIFNDGTTLEVQIKAMGSSAFNIGTSNLSFEFDPLVVDNPVLGINSLTGSFNVNVTQPLPNAASFNIELTSTNNGSNIGTDFTDIGTIEFDIVDAGAAPGSMEWRYTGSTTQTVIFLDDDATAIFATDPGCLVGLATPTPVELISFAARKNGNKSILNWATASEQNAERFEIQRSGNGRSWEKLTSVAAIGNSYHQQQYFVTDENPFAGNNYYRLKMIDFDQSFAYSQIELLSFGRDKEVGFFPNPANNSVTLSYAYDRQLAELTIYDQVGAKVLQLVKPQKRVIDLKPLKTGVHFMEFRFKDEIIVKKLFVEKGE